MKTRAQRQRDQAAGAPTSPAHELPATRPRRVAKPRNVRESPARTAIRNATRKAIERESLGEGAITSESPRDEAASNVQGADGHTGDHHHSEIDHSSLTQNPAQQTSPFLSPFSRAVPDDEILGQGIYAPSSSPLSSPPSQYSSLSSPPSQLSSPYPSSSPDWDFDDRSPSTRAWQARPVPKYTPREEEGLRRYGARFPKEPYAILHFWESPTLQDMESARPVSKPTVAVAIPKPHIGEFLNDLAAKYPGAVMRRTYTNVAVQVDLSTTAVKRKSQFDTESPRADGRVGFGEDETPSNRRIIGYNPAPLYDDKGKLRLGPRFVAVYADSTDDEDTDNGSQAEDSESGGDSIDLCMSGALQPASEPVQQPPQPQQEIVSHQVTETPSRSRWGIGKILDSASKYVPGLGRRARATATPISVDSTPQNPPTEKHRPSTEPRLNTQPVVASTSTPKTPATAKPSRRSRLTSKTQPQTNKVAKPKRKTARDSKQMSRRNKHIQEKIDADEEKARDSQAERDFIADQIRILNEEQARKAQADKKPKSKSKRKRAPSPDEIPHPPGCSYGFDPKYFVVSDEESDVAVTPSPSPDRPSKSRRIDRPPPPDPLLGRKENAKPYTGAIFGSGTPIYHGGNVFREYEVQKASAEKAAALKRSAAATPKDKELRTEDGTKITNLSGHFSVPDDSDDETDESELIPSPSAGKAEAASKDASTSKHPTPATAPEKPTEQPAVSWSPMTSNTPLKSKAQTWTQPPPPPPNPSHASLPPSTSTDSESLKAARAKALQHAPRKPSGLRESSRITSSPAAPSDTDAVQTPKGFTIMQPAVDHQETAPSASDEAIAQIQDEVANSPTPPLHEVLGVLTEKAANGQTKSSAKASPDSAPLEAQKTPSKAARSSAADPPKSPQGYTLPNGFHISKNVVQVVEAQMTPEVRAMHEDAIAEDYQNWKRLHPEKLPPPETIEYSQEDLDREAEKEIQGYYEWRKYH